MRVTIKDKNRKQVLFLPGDKYIFRWYFSDTFLTGFSVVGVGGRLTQSRDWSFLSIYTLRQLLSISLACNPALIILRAGHVLYFTRV